MNPYPQDETLIAGTVEIISRAFDGFYHSFRRQSSEAKMRFEQRQWNAQRETIGQRIEWHQQVLRQTIQALRTHWPTDSLTNQAWQKVERMYSQLVANESYALVAHSFVVALRDTLFPSLSGAFREEWLTWSQSTTTCESGLPMREYSLPGLHPGQSLTGTIEKILLDLHWQTPYAQLAEDTYWLGQALAAQLPRRKKAVLGLYPSLFYRNEHAYLLGRMELYDEQHTPMGSIPLAIAFIHPPAGIKADALLTGAAAIKPLFAFSRSNFLVDTADPAALVTFVLTLIPSKPIAQLYLNLGYLYYGKQLLYHQLLLHLQQSQEQFCPAPGVPGLVMLVLTLPTYPLVLKILRNTSRPPKSVTRDQVHEKYQLVAHHDRVGRLADAQYYEQLTVPKAAFPVGLLDELLTEASDSVTLRQDHVVLQQVYLERKLRPLNLFLQEASPEDCLPILHDYGRAIKEIAMSNLFPGDLLLKNFGVTAEGSVVFYDYDEVVPLTECTFRAIPQASTEEDLLSAEPWFPVRENDVFPEELLPFLVPAGKLRDAFLREHEDLFASSFWNKLKARLLSGWVVDLPPYQSRF